MVSLPGISLDNRKRIRRQNRIVKNQALIWKCLSSRYPLRDKDPRIQRFGEFEDLVQECIQHAIRKCMYFDPEKGKLSTWLYTVVRWHAHRMLRSTGVIRASYSWKDNDQAEEIERRNRVQRVKSITEREHLIKGEDGRSLQKTQDIQKDVRQALLSCLSSEERSILKITYYQNMTENEISTKLKITIPRIKMIKRRAMGKLREFMEKQNAV